MEQLGSHWTDFHEILYLSKGKGKGKGKVNPRTGHESP
jgi:hypothetical protein